MKCPFCKLPIAENIKPFEHMLFCQKEEAKLWDGRFKLMMQAAARQHDNLIQEEIS